MQESLSTLLAKVKVSSDRLNELTNQANSAVKAVEEFLTLHCRIGIATFVPIASETARCGHDACNGAMVYMAYLRYAGRFRIVLVATQETCQIDPNDPNGGETIRAWDECSRDEKLEAVAFLPTLVASILDRLNEKVEKAQVTLSATSDFLHQLKLELGE